MALFFLTCFSLFYTLSTLKIFWRSIKLLQWSLYDKTVFGTTSGLISESVWKIHRSKQNTMIWDVWDQELVVLIVDGSLKILVYTNLCKTINVACLNHAQISS